MAKQIIVIPGSFNPFHAGHEFIGDTCRQFYESVEIYYEITDNNIDKGLISEVEIQKRIKAIEDKHWDTIRCPYPAFVDKADYYAKKFPWALNKKWYTPLLYQEFYFSFAVGMDTFARILDPKYTGSKAKLNEQLRHMLKLGVSFIVFKRGEQSFAALRKQYWEGNDPTDLDVIEFRTLFHELAIETPNISSTEIRERNAKNDVT